MAEVKFKIYLNKGREGIPVHKLAAFTTEIDKFLKLVSIDLGVEKVEWQAEQFRNKCLEFYTTGKDIPDPQAVTMAKALDQITDVKTSVGKLNYGITPQTFAQFGRIASVADTDEVVGFGVVTDKGTLSKRILTKQRAEAIVKQTKQKTNKYCGYTATITAFFPSTCKVHLSEKLTGKPIYAVFKQEMYSDIVETLNRPDALINVEGWLRQEVSEPSPHLFIQHISKLPAYTAGTLENFFGCDPDLLVN